LAGGSGCQCFDSSRCFISSIPAWFLIYIGHAVCFCTLVTILDASCSYFLIQITNLIITFMC
jgi:hypothetical protein